MTIHFHSFMADTMIEVIHCYRLQQNTKGGSMKFNSEKSINVLKIALEREKAAEVFYTEKAQSMTEPGTGTILKDLARDEHIHMELVSSLLKEAESGAESTTVTTQPSVSPKERIESIFSELQNVSPLSLPEKSTVREVFEFALDIEKKSFDYYSQAAADAENDEVAAVYRFFTAEENKHYIMISNVLDFIDDPGRWLYEEENLIFRR